MKSKTKIEIQSQRKTNSEIVKTIISANKNKEWAKVASVISSPRRKMVEVNLEEINKETKEGDKIIIPGKVLSQGDITKKIKVVALGFSEEAKRKLLKSKSETSKIIDEIKSNPHAKGLKFL